MTGDDRRANEATGSASDVDLARRFDRLSSSIEQGRRDRAAAEPRPHRSTDYGAALRLASEFVAGIIVGAALGWGLDQVAGTSPWGLIGFLLLGFAAGVVNVMRAAGRMATPESRLGKGGLDG